MTDEYYLEIPEDFENQPISDCQSILPLVTDFVGDYELHQDEPVEDWLTKKMQKELPERNTDEVARMAKEIVESLRTYEEKKASLEQSLEMGRSKESWFSNEVLKATSSASTLETQFYLSSLDNAIGEANELMKSAITTKAGEINQSPCLDGNIAEEYHAQTFNLNAEARGSRYRARTLRSNGKNTVDIVIDDLDGNKCVRRYQSKYYKKATETEGAFSEGSYNGQQSLVPSDQKPSINRKCTDHIEAPDGTCSNKLTKGEAQRLKEDAQSGNWKDYDWNNYKAADLAKGIGRQAGQAALMGAAIGAGTEIVGKLIKGEEIEVKEVAKKAIVSGADFGVKAAAAGAIKVGAEKGLLKMIPKGTPVATIANVVFVGVEDAKILYKMANGELTGKEGLRQIETTTVSAACGLACMAKGASVGAALGTILGPVGTAIGGFIGGTVGYMAGSAAGSAIVDVSRKIRHTAVKAVKAVAKGVASVAKSIFRGIGNLLFG